MGQTRVDLLHLLEDLRDAYPGSVEDTILTEVVANSLDSGARRISVRADPADAVLVVVDDGSGMTRRELGRYHDIAASTKQRGRGIGFAGVGIKLGLLVSEEVLTETRRGAVHAATRWRLAAKTRAPWHWVDPPGFVEGTHGTGVCLKLRNALSPLLDAGFLEAALRRHFQPLLDEAFGAILADRYPQGVELRVNGRTLAPDPALPSRVRIAVRLPRSRRPAAVGFLERGTAPLDEESRGVAVSTLGKVIRRGWDWLGLAAAAPPDVSGLIEAPGLAESLTLNKGDFLRSGPRGFVYLGFRRAIQQAVAAQLAGGSAPGTDDRDQRRSARRVEKDLETVLTWRRSSRRSPRWWTAAGSPPAGESAAAEPTAPEPQEPRPAAVPEQPEAPVTLPVAARGPRTPARYGLSIHFRDQPDSSELAHLVETQVVVNTAHPAWRRAAASRLEGYHIALCVAMALAPLAAEARGTHEFVTTFLARWGKALGRDRRRRGAR